MTELNFHRGYISLLKLSFVPIICFFLLLSNSVFAESPLAISTTNNNIISSVKLTPSEQQWISEHPEITIAFDANYPPYSFKNEQGEFVGIAVDITKKLAAKTSLKFSIYPNGQWKNLYYAAQTGSVDVIATLVKHSERESWFEFTRPYLSLSQYIISRKENLNESKSIKSLANKSVALVEGYSTTELILHEEPTIKPYYVDSLSDALAAVSAGIADATVGDIGIANHLITRSGLSNLAFTSLYTNKLSKQRFGVRKDWPQLATIMDKALESLSYQELTNLYLKWRVPEIVRPEAGFISVLGELTHEEKQWLKEHPVIRLASDFAWPPFENIDQHGNYSGIAAEYMKLIEKRLAIKFINSPREPWDKIVDKVKNKELDVFSCAMETNARKDFTKFTEPYISYPMVLVSRDDIGYIDGLNGIYGKTIAIEKSYATYDILKQNHPHIKLQPHQDTASALRSVSAGNAYAYIGNIAAISYTLREQGLSNLKVSGKVPYEYSLSMGVRDDWKEFVPILQKALDSISLEEKNKILKHWVKIKISDQFNYDILWKSAAAFIFIIIIFSYWNYSLNQKIKKRTAELHHQANYDSLTGLPNRAMSISTLTSLIDEAIMKTSNVAVLVLDIDDFKKINNALGHHTGDQLLTAIAKRLNTTLTHVDLLGHIGGDEFTIYIGNLKTNEDTFNITQKTMNILYDCFSQPFKLDGRDIKLTLSIGASFYPNDGNNVFELMRNADMAMYHAKSLGRNTYAFFDSSMNKIVSRRLQLDECMHGAMERGEFEVHFQPKIKVNNRKIMGFEALLRWNNATLGSVSPDEFIPIAESNGLIVNIGKFVLNEAIKNLLHWQSITSSSLNMAVNLSPIQLRDQGFVTYIENLLSETGVSASCLELEITEGVLMSGYSDIKISISELKELGLRLAMDDFGTGYSSLSYLRNYPFDVIKIDREFIFDIEENNSDCKLAQATIAIASSLELKVVAEGVETEEQLKILAGYGCDYAQGYLFSKPGPADEITKYL